jgi:hypothetical protein
VQVPSPELKATIETMIARYRELDLVKISAQTHTLREIGDALDGVEYKNVSKAVRRFADSLANHSNRRKIARSLLSHLANGET